MFFIICAFGTSLSYHIRCLANLQVNDKPSRDTCYVSRYYYCPSDRDEYNFTVNYASAEDIRVMRFYRCPAVKYVPSGIFTSLPELEILDISNSNLEELTASDFVDANHLQEFNGSRNKLQMIKKSVFSYVARLAESWAHEITKISVDDDFPLHQLWRINLEHNHIFDIEDYSFYGLNNLVNLELRGNDLLTIRKNTFAGIPSLGFLDLSENDLRTIEEGAFDFVELDVLHLNGNELKRLSDNLFDRMPNVQRISLHQNALERIGRSLYNLSNVNTISLGDNHIIDIDLVEFAQLPKLNDLKLDNSGFTFDTTSDEYRPINSSLKALDLSQNNLTDASDLIRLRIFRNLCVLNLNVNPFTNFTIPVKTATDAPEEPNLTHQVVANVLLALSKTYVGAAVDVAQQLEHQFLADDWSLKNVLPKLTKLDLDHTNMTCDTLTDVDRTLKAKHVKVNFQCRSEQ